MAKIDEWLTKQGLLGKKKTPEKPTVKPEAAKKTTPVKTQTSSTSKSNPRATSKPRPRPNSSRPPQKKNFGKGGKPGRFQKIRSLNPDRVLTNYDPLQARPTVEKREKHHPTNRLQGTKKPVMRVVPLGGMEQVGMNMMLIETDDDIIVIDNGLVFPSPEHMGVDALIPDISYLKKNKHKIRGIIFTHGHYDHIGGCPYILPELGFPPSYATRLAKEIMYDICKEYIDVKNLKVAEINPKSKLKLGIFEIEFFHINHSIPDGVGVVIHTPYGIVTHSSDFKFDYNPSDDQPIDLGRIAEIGSQGVILSMSDSTNALKPGFTLSERIIEDELGEVIKKATGRIVMATFASNIGRISKLIESAEQAGRTVFVSGRSMERNILIARKLNYLKCKDRTLQLMSRKADKMDPSKVFILSTGSQGEELAALTRMAAGLHRDIKLRKEDTVVFSSSPIPGNELAIVSVLNNLAHIGCKVVDNRNYDTHVSGHAQQEECKLLHSLLNPKYFVPIHGEVFMRHAHRDLIVKTFDFRPENTFIMMNGRGLIFSENGVRLMAEKDSLSSGDVFVQVGEKVQDKTIADRKLLASNGIIIAHLKHVKGKLKDVDVHSRGFVYMNARHEIFKQIEKEIRLAWDRNYDPARPDSVMVPVVRSVVEKFMRQKFRKDAVVEVLV
jgi:ribonuclease J